jgi:putative ABC transport system substrate-binding protein
MRRRGFLSLLGAAAAWPTAVVAQNAPPIIGWLSPLSAGGLPKNEAQFLRGLREAGFVPGQNVEIDYRWANGQYERLPAMATELVRRPVDVIFAQSPPAALAAKTATTMIPIVFTVGVDPVATGLVVSLNRPGGNVTGSTLISGPLGQKRIEILRELLPKATVIAMLVNPKGPDTAPEIRDVEVAAQVNKLKLRLFKATTPIEIDAAFDAIKNERPDALLVGGDPFFSAQRSEIVEHVAKVGVVAVYPFREFAEAGGLISYGASIPGAQRQAGVYIGRILKGAAPNELPVIQPTTFELVINLRTAKSQGLDIPPTLHARSDDVIE